MLIHELFVEKEGNISDKYFHIKMEYLRHPYMMLNNVKVFAPYPEPDVCWDISEAQKIATYNPEVTKVLSWINCNIVVNLFAMTYKTLDVLIRIATGMLNKCNIPNEYKILFHDNMVRNLRSEHENIILSDLPF